jgi:hypothetical protein
MLKWTYLSNIGLNIQIGVTWFFYYYFFKSLKRISSLGCDIIYLGSVLLRTTIDDEMTNIYVYIYIFENFVIFRYI